MMHSVFNELNDNDEIEIIPIFPRRQPCSCPYCAQGGIRDESGNKLHCCPYENCDKILRKTSHLKVHMRSHSGEKPFKCNWKACDREFSRSDELTRHIRTHTADKRYNCDKCDKKFMRSDHLHKHLRTHNKDPNNKLKPCPYCNRKFLRLDNFELHIQSHNVTEIPDNISNVQGPSLSNILKRYSPKMEINKEEFSEQSQVLTKNQENSRESISQDKEDSNNSFKLEEDSNRPGIIEINFPAPEVEYLEE